MAKQLATIALFLAWVWVALRWIAAYPDDDGLIVLLLTVAIIATEWSGK